MNILVSCMASEEATRTFFSDRVKDELARCGDVRYGVFTPDELREELRGVEVLFACWGIPRLDEDMLVHADSLKLVCYTGGSVAGFMTEALTQRGIRVLSGNQLFANSVAEGTIGYILLAQRRLVKLINETAEMGWPDTFHHSDGIRFKSIGIIGFGMIAKYLAKMLQAFECRVKICSDYFHKEDEAEYRAEKCEIEEIFACDIVTLHESLREDTYHWIDRRFFSLMKPNSLFVNTARGPIIVEQDLVEAAKTGGIRAILDVYEQEPLPMDSPLRGCENIILVPHRGGPTIDIREHVTLALIGDLRKWLSGETTLEHEISLAYARNMTHSISELRKR